MPSALEEGLAKIRDEHRRLGELLEGCQGEATQVAAIGACIERMALVVGAPASPTTELRTLASDFRQASTTNHHYIDPDDWRLWAEILERAIGTSR